MKYNRLNSHLVAVFAGLLILTILNAGNALSQVPVETGANMPQLFLIRNKSMTRHWNLAESLVGTNSTPVGKIVPTIPSSFATPVHVPMLIGGEWMRVGRVVSEITAWTLV